MGSVDEPSWCWHPRTRRFYGIESRASEDFNTALYHLDFVNRPSTGVGLYGSTAVSSHLVVRDACMRYWSHRDVLVVLGYSNSAAVMRIQIYDPRSPGVAQNMTLTGTTLPVCAPGFAYVPHLNSGNGAFFMRDPTAGQEQKLWRIDPPSSAFASTAWTVTLITMAGDTVSGTSPNGVWKRFDFAPQINSLIWVSSVTSAVYAYNVGTS